MLIKLYDNPIPNIPIIEPDNIPEPGDIFLGYEVLYDKSIFAKPRCKYMKTRGWISVILLFLCFCPATCVPCCMSCSYDICQRPVYGRTFFPNYVLLRSVEFKPENNKKASKKDNDPSVDAKSENIE